MDYQNWQESSDDLHAMSEAEDKSEAVRFGGPITNGMLMTAINQCVLYDVAAHNVVDCEKLAKIINSWLVPVN